MPCKHLLMFPYARPFLALFPSSWSDWCSWACITFCSSTTKSACESAAQHMKNIWYWSDKCPAICSGCEGRKWGRDCGGSRVSWERGRMWSEHLSGPRCLLFGLQQPLLGVPWVLFSLLFLSKCYVAPDLGSVHVSCVYRPGASEPAVLFITFFPTREW